MSLLAYLSDHRLFRYPVALDRDPELLNNSRGVDPQPLRALTFAAPDDKPFALDERGRLVEIGPLFGQWGSVLSCPPVAGDRVALAAGEGYVVYGGEDGRIRVVDRKKWADRESRRDGTAIRAVDTPPTSSVAVSANGRWLAATGSDISHPRATRLWSLPDLKPAGEWESPRYTTVTLSPDGATVAATHYKADEVALFEAKTGRQLGVTNLDGEKLTIVRFLPDGSELLAAGETGVVHRLNPRTGERLEPPKK